MSLVILNCSFEFADGLVEPTCFGEDESNQIEHEWIRLGALT